MTGTTTFLFLGVGWLCVHSLIIHYVNMYVDGIGLGYRNVAVNVYQHEPLMRISTSSYRDRSKFACVIAGALNSPYSVLSSEKTGASTWRESRICRWQLLVYLKIKVRENATVI